MGNEDLGRHYYNIGELPESFKAFHRMRDFCTNAKHVADMSARLALTCIAQRNWQSAASQLAKIEQVNLKPEERQLLDPVVHAVSGLLDMCIGNFKEAANSFLSTSYSFVTAEPLGGITWQKEVLTGNDVAVYGGLCALSSMDRPTLQKKVLNNPEFRQFLELEPHIRRAVSLFCSSKYSACLDILEAYRTDYLLDLYLNPILKKIYGTIRTKSIVQYFIPYSCVGLDEMAKAFHSKDGTPLEQELKAMIESGALDARIDLVDRVSNISSTMTLELANHPTLQLLISPPSSPRHTAHSEAMTMAQSYEHQLRLRLVRLNMLASGLEVKDPKKIPGREGILNEGEMGMEAGMLGVGGERGGRRGWGGRFGAF